MANDWQSLPPTFTACSTEDNGETEDYLISIIDLDACQGTPSAGTVDDPAFIVCAMTPFNVSVSDASAPMNSLIRVWQFSPAGLNNWTGIEGASATDYQIENGISTPTDFRYYTLCTPSGESAVSDIITVGLKPALECYCIPEYLYGCAEGDLISNVTLEGESITLNNTSQCSDNAFGDYTTGLPKPDLAPGESYTISVSTSYGIPHFEEVMAWIDYNEDGHFGDDEIIAATVGNGLEYGTLSFGFTVPTEIEVGEYRLRVRLVFDWSDNIPTFDECGIEDYGETEDYTISIIEMDACQDAPSAGTPDIATFDICPLTPFLISVSGTSQPAIGLTGIWQSSPANQDAWADIAGAGSINYTIAQGIQEPTHFRYTLACANSEQSDTSDIIQVGLKPATECYCIPFNNIYTEYFISSITTSGGLQNLNRQSGFTEGGYADYTETDTLVVSPAQTIDFTISFEIGTQLVRAWIDYNQDGIFQENELVITTDESYVQNPYTGSFTVSENITAGNYRMRFKITSNSTPISPCGDDMFAETEDYSFKVVQSTELDCPDLEANIGDPCTTDTIENGMISSICECEPIVSTAKLPAFTFRLYPNPVSTTEFITLISNQSIDRYEIMDIRGKRIETKSIQNQNHFKIPLIDYSPGVYILKAHNGSDFATQKIVVR